MQYAFLAVSPPKAQANQGVGHTEEHVPGRCRAALETALPIRSNRLGAGRGAGRAGAGAGRGAGLGAAPPPDVILPPTPMRCRPNGVVLTRAMIPAISATQGMGSGAEGGGAVATETPLLPCKPQSRRNSSAETTCPPRVGFPAGLRLAPKSRALVYRSEKAYRSVCQESFLSGD